MPIAPAKFIDTFSDTNASGWGTIDSGQSWTTSNLILSESGGLGTITNNANTGLGTARLNLPDGGTARQTRDSVLMKVRVTASSQWPLTDFGPMLSYSGTNTFYYLALQGNWGEIAIGVYINGYRYEIHRTAYSFVKNVDYWVRFERHATGLRAKIWTENEAEPRNWTLTSGLWDGSAPPPAGSPGIWKRGTRDTHNINIHTFYYYPSGYVDKPNLPADTFLGRVTSQGFGVSSSGHLWTGAFGSDPDAHRLNEDGAVLTTTSDFGRSTLTDTNEHSAILGPTNITGDIENVIEFIAGNNSSGGSVRIRTGLRGKPAYHNGRLQPTGYMCQVETGQQNIYIYSRSTADGAYVHIGTGALGFVLNTQTKYFVKFQYATGTFRARCWAAGTTEPTTWQVAVEAAADPSGGLWFSLRQTVNGIRYMDIHSVAYQTPSVGSGVTKNYTTTGQLYVTPRERDASFTARSYDDADADRTITVRYKPASATAWINHPIIINRVGNDIPFSISGLQPATTYNVEVTWQDPDGVVGTNPQRISFTTSENSIQPKAITVNSIDTTSVEVQATYTRDLDNDSQATVSYRTTNASQKLVEDYFVDEDDDELLQNTTSRHGGTWVKHAASTPTAQGVVRAMRIFADTAAATDKILYYHDTQPPVDEYSVTGEFLATALNGTTGIAGRVSTTQETYYGAGINARDVRWEIFKVVNGVKTILETTDFVHPIGVVHSLELIVRDAYKALVLNGNEILRTTDNEITDRGYGGYYSTDIVQGSYDNQFLLDTLIVSYRNLPGEWSGNLAMSVDRTAKAFVKMITGLNPDTIYEFRVSFIDPDGVIEPNYLLVTAQTTGTAAGLVAMGASPQATSAIIDVFYEFDANDNAYIEFQYKSTMDYLWTSVPFMNAYTDRTIKKFSMTLTALQPSQTYEVRAFIVDADGLIEGSPTVLSGLFTTKGFLVQDQKQKKHYIWKVYDKKNRYISTIPDAPEPEFSLHQNGGVTDLSFELPRKMAELKSEGIIDFQNRIDIWAIDPSSDGMGPNMIADPDASPTVGAWTHSSISSYRETDGPDGSSCIRISAANSDTRETLSSTINIGDEVPLVISCVARASGAKLRMYARAYDINDVALDSSAEIAETIGTSWQKLKINYTPPAGTAYIRVIIRNTGRGVMYADKFVVLAKEVLIYRGKIEAYTPEVTENGETVQIEVLGLASLLSDDYIEFLQFVEVQPQKDVDAKRISHGAKDPADMMKMVIDMAKRQNPHFELYYTTDSIQYTGNLMQYTFRDQQIRNCMDKIRSLCPAGWHYYIEADGLVWLRSQESATVHTLRIGVEILRFNVERSIRNLKNYVRVKGRQDEDLTETDGHGSINYIAFDQKSIDSFGKRTVFIRDAQLTDPESAKIVGDGRLEEYNREEQRVECYVPDNKVFQELSGSLRGYNIESFRPGDTVVIIDPIAGGRKTFWDKFRWDVDAWDTSGVFSPLPEPVPIVTIQNHGNYAQLELSERPPSQVGDFSRLYRWMANKERE